ncbi:MAG: type II toxin-antitoxin system VapC family toxin [Verrucomicrobiota bacterium]|nr:type II toxin-antitoxin system VapC family toxin [Verrucomicrobiota bacterium]
MRILLDTQCWLWWITEPERLRETARKQIQDGRNAILLSSASSWEIAIKYALGKLPLLEPPEEFVPKRMSRDAISALPIEHVHALRVASLPDHHRDPFDRLLVAQAQVEGIPLMTVDRQFEAYDIEIIRGA